MFKGIKSYRIPSCVTHFTMFSDRNICLYRWTGAFFTFLRLKNLRKMCAETNVLSKVTQTFFSKNNSRQVFINIHIFHVTEVMHRQTMDDKIYHSTMAFFSPNMCKVPHSTSFNSIFALGCKQRATNWVQINFPTKRHPPNVTQPLLNLPLLSTRGRSFVS